MEATIERPTDANFPTALTRSRVLRWSLWATFVVGWTTALLTPQPVHLAKRVLPEEALFSSFKVAHVTCYALMAVLSGWLQLGPRGRRWLLGFLSGHAFLTEFLQQFVPGRTAALLDVAVDHLGILLGLVLTWKWWQSPKA